MDSHLPRQRESRPACSDRVVDPGATVLLVDSNEDDVLLTRRELGRHGLQLVAVADGPGALQLLLPEPGRAPLAPALVLLDLRPLLMDGQEILRRLRDDPRTVALPVLLLTASMHEDDTLLLVRDGRTGLLRKPIGYDTMCEAIGLLHARRAAARTLTA